MRQYFVRIGVILEKLAIYLNNGRDLEIFLGGGEILLFIYMFTSTSGINHILFSDSFQKSLPEVLIIIPLFIVGLLHICGVVLNCIGVQQSWLIRGIAAIGGLTIWIYVLVKSLYISDINLVMVFPVWLIIWNMHLMWKASNRLPLPGSVQPVTRNYG